MKICPKDIWKKNFKGVLHKKKCLLISIQFSFIGHYLLKDKYYFQFETESAICNCSEFFHCIAPGKGKKKSVFNFALKMTKALLN